MRKIWARAHGRRYRLGLAQGFKNSLVTLTIATMATFVLFCAGLGDVIMGVVKLAWGSAPVENPGVMYWSWPVIQIVCVAVVWAWSRVFMRLIEEATHRASRSGRHVRVLSAKSSADAAGAGFHAVRTRDVLADRGRHVLRIAGVRVLGAVHLLTGRMYLGTRTCGERMHNRMR